MSCAAVFDKRLTAERTWRSFRWLQTQSARAMRCTRFFFSADAIFTIFFFFKTQGAILKREGWMLEFSRPAKLVHWIFTFNYNNDSLKCAQTWLINDSHTFWYHLINGTAVMSINALLPYCAFSSMSMLPEKRGSHGILTCSGSFDVIASSTSFSRYCCVLKCTVT